jgi:hypothetical protein
MDEPRGRIDGHGGAERDALTAVTVERRAAGLHRTDLLVERIKEVGQKRHAVDLPARERGQGRGALGDVGRHLVRQPVHVDADAEDRAGQPSAGRHGLEEQPRHLAPVRGDDVVRPLQARFHARGARAGLARGEGRRQAELPRVGGEDRGPDRDAQGQVDARRRYPRATPAAASGGLDLGEHHAPVAAVLEQLAGTIVRRADRLVHLDGVAEARARSDGGRPIGQEGEGRRIVWHRTPNHSPTRGGARGGVGYTRRP